MLAVESIACLNRRERERWWGRFVSCIDIYTKEISWMNWKTSTCTWNLAILVPATVCFCRWNMWRPDWRQNDKCRLYLILVYSIEFSCVRIINALSSIWVQTRLAVRHDHVMCLYIRGKKKSQIDLSCLDSRLPAAVQTGIVTGRMWLLSTDSISVYRFPLVLRLSWQQLFFHCSRLSPGSFSQLCKLDDGAAQFMHRALI